MILYGQTAVGEYAVQTAEWHYYLGDAQLSVRQLVDESGVVIQARTYGPYGVLLHQVGDGGGLFGYKGGQSGANGLWFFGDGYFDPHTGQFLAANGRPLLPLTAAAMANPGGMLFGPVLLLNWRKRKGKKGIHPATFLLLGVLLAAGLSSCENPTPIPVEVTEAPPTEGVGQTKAPTPTSPGTPKPPTPPTPIPTNEPTPTIPPVPCRDDTTPPIAAPFKTIFFGGSDGNTDIAGPTKGMQTTAWDDKIKDEDWYQYPGYPNQPGLEGSIPFLAEHLASKEDPDLLEPDGSPNEGLTGKNLHAWIALQNYRGYTGKLNVIGYSAGADTAQIFAGKFIGQGGQIHKMVLLDPSNDSIRDDLRFPNSNWTTQTDRIYFPNEHYEQNLIDIVGTGTQVRVYDDWGGGVAIPKANVPGPNYELYPIDKIHWDGGIEGSGVNNDSVFADDIFKWLDE